MRSVRPSALQSRPWHELQSTSFAGCGKAPTLSPTLSHTGTAYSWQEGGAADGGQLGHGPDCGDRGRPWPVEFVYDGGRRLAQHAWKAEAVSCGFNHTIAIVSC